ncbi:MAG: substrate-binding domain-containing protein [Planctomycetaceae bacterium]|nr:substrate-binding domain-containing protein [Planctomycetaceae bacterium]
MRTIFLLCFTIVFSGIVFLGGCSSRPFDPSEYMRKHDIKCAADMNEEHWNKLLANVPKDSRQDVIERLDKIHQAADDFDRAYQQAEDVVCQLGLEQHPLHYAPDNGDGEWQFALRQASEAMSNYPVVFDAAKKAEYWKESTENLFLCLDDRIAQFHKLVEQENAESLRLQSLDKTATPEEQRHRKMRRTPFLRQLTEEQKERLRNGEPLFKNPYLGVATNHDAESVVVSRWSLHNPAQVYLFELRNEELASKRVLATPELEALDLTVGDLLRWDGSTSLKPPATIMAAHIAHLPLEWGGSVPWEWDGAMARPLGFAEEPYPIPEISKKIPKDAVFLSREESEEVSESLRSGVKPAWMAHVSEPPTMPTIENPDAKPDTEFLNQWKFSQTHQAYVNLIEGTRDLMFATRIPSEDEIALAKQKNVELELHPFAKDAFVFIANRNNPVRDLTLEQVRDIFSGKITQWKKVGGYGGTILPFLRNRNSGSEELMRELVMKDQPVKEGLYQVVMSMEGVYDLLEKAEAIHGIGYTILYFDRYMVRSPFTRTIRINGIEPTPQTVADGTYPLLYECVAVVRKDGPEKAKAIARWLSSEEGVKVVRESGYVPLDLTK